MSATPLIIGKAGSIIAAKQPVQLAEAIVLLVYKANTRSGSITGGSTTYEEKYQQFCDGHYDLVSQE